MKEMDLIAPLVNTFVRQGYKAYAEVRFSSRWIDIFMINEENQSTIAVELKLTEWKKAYKQAKVYQMVADYVYVGMPEQYVHRAIHNSPYFEELGIGLLSINGKAVEVIEAKRSNIQIKEVKSELIENLDPDMEVILDEKGDITKTFYPCGRIK